MTAFDTPDKMVQCPALVTIKVISGKWKTRILWVLREEELGFNALRKELGDVSQKVLAEQLKQLEQDGIISVDRELNNGVNLSSYRYTVYGKSLIPILDAMGEWGIKHNREQIN